MFTVICAVTVTNLRCDLCIMLSVTGDIYYIAIVQVIVSHAAATTDFVFILQIHVVTVFLVRQLCCDEEKNDLSNATSHDFQL